MKNKERNCEILGQLDDFCKLLISNFETNVSVKCLKIVCGNIAVCLTNVSAKIVECLKVLM